jgi:hypothetical protein
MARSLDFIQIYYREEQKSEMYDFAIPYLNETLTPYFENSVISDLVPKSNADLISVCSWRLRKKRTDRAMQLRGATDLSEDKIIHSDFDVAVLTPVSSSHQALLMAEQWHGEVWVKAINKLREFIKIPRELKHPIYENHFIATKEIYHDYVNHCLVPTMAFVSGHSEFFDDSGYAKRKTAEERNAYFLATGKMDWPIAPFILERLFSTWINDKGLNIIKL